ncbi:MAG TPA: hypothetical protein VFX97_12545 [Pyrinomonadaceae bacterium]|nr:hypothetical protein [Pyrinomonadaceae bacterium]
MNRIRLAALCLLLIAASTQAQTSSLPAPQKTKQPLATKELDPETVQRRSIALSMLESLAIEARSYRDEPLRARVQARTADALWDQDKEAARSLFRRAWDVAESVEISATMSTNLAPDRVAPGRPVRPRTNLRREILQLAAKRDHALGEEFLRRLNAKNEKDEANNSTASRPEMSAAEMAERLMLAGGFLEADEIDRALQFADPALVRATERSILFLVSLREKNAAAADQRFAALLSLSAADPASDANTVSLLTSYAFTPSIYLVVSRGGIPSSNSYPPKAPPDLAPALRKSYFQVAANILLRPLAQIEQSSAGRAGTHFIATRIWPLFQRYAPDLAPAIAAQLAALGPEAGQATTNAGNLSLNRGMNDNGRREGLDDELNERLKGAQSADARDRVYAFAAMRAADEGDPRAREYVDKIEDLETRAGLRRFVDYSFIRSLLAKKRADEALALLSKADLPRSLRAHFLIQAAAIVAEKNQARALELLDEALTETRRIDAGTPERAYCLLALLTQFSKWDKDRAWQLLSEMVKSANAVKDFTGENGNTALLLEGKFSIRMGTELAKPTDLSTLFARLAEENFYQALDAARSFAGDAPRAIVMISIARAVFEKKPERPSTSQRR